MGHFSTEWATKHGPFEAPSGTIREAYMLEAAVVEVSLKWFLDLGKTKRNKQPDSRLNTKSLLAK